MVNFIRNAVVLIGIAAVFGLFAAKPLMPVQLRPLVPLFAILVVAATFLLVVIVNKLFFGVYAPGPRMTLAQPEYIRQSVRKDWPMPLLSVVCFGGVGFLPIILVKELGWSRSSAIEVGVVAPIIMVFAFNAIRALYR